MATTDKKTTIKIRIAEVKPFELSVAESEKSVCEESEKLVNTLWNKWMARFKGTDSSEEVMAKVAFQFARLYHQAYNDNLNTKKFLADFEKQLNDIVLKMD